MATIDPVEVYLVTDPSAIDVMILADKKDATGTWKNKQAHEMLAKIQEEILELILSMTGNHEGPPRLELTQIASGAINMLRQMDRRSLWREFPSGTKTEAGNKADEDS